ncbi:MAG: diguanylate cyclase domain-containing protein [Roseicyclus sp.]
MNLPVPRRPESGFGMARLFDRLLPMHVEVGRDGHIRHAGPTFVKMTRGRDVIGRRFAEVIDIRKPRAVASHDDLLSLEGQRLTLTLETASDLALRGVATALPRGDGLLLDISLGPGFQRAVARFDLTMSDFSHCDQTVELLYLAEANAAISRLSRQLTERLSAARAAAERQALTDALTGLRNRRAMDAELARLLADPDLPFALLHIDLDRFKQVNDTLGHAAGDRILMHVGDILRTELRPADISARVGGDEFLAVLKGRTAAEDLAITAGRLIRRIEEPVPFGGRVARVSASIGITATTAYAARPGVERLLGDADAALYRAKGDGRGRFRFHGVPAGWPGARDRPRRRRSDDARG